MRKLFFLILFSSNLLCWAQSGTINQKAVKMNNRAIKTIMAGGDATKNYQKANLILDSAIKIEPRYQISYGNKVQNLIRLGEYKRAIAVTDSLLSFSPSLEMLTTKGVLLQKIGDHAAAKQNYEKALKFGQSAYKVNATPTLLGNIAVALFFLEGNQKAAFFIETEKKKFLNDPKSLKQIQTFEKMIPEFTVDKFLGVKRPSGTLYRVKRTVS